jgi:uncharacterized damage-inducible protein DinB
MTTWPTPSRPNTPKRTDERTSLETWLDFHRTTLLMKCAGLSPDRLAERSCPPSRLSLLGLLRHMTEVETWFHDFDGQPRTLFFGTETEPEADFEALDPARADDDRVAFLASVDRARAAVAGRDLDELSPVRQVPTSLRWVFQHMIEEYARHNGHADLLRERIDGATGD